MTHEGILEKPRDHVASVAASYIVTYMQPSMIQFQANNACIPLHLGIDPSTTTRLGVLELF